MSVWNFQLDHFLAVLNKNKKFIEEEVLHQICETGKNDEKGAHL